MGRRRLKKQESGGEEGVGRGKNQRWRWKGREGERRGREELTKGNILSLLNDA